MLGNCPLTAYAMRSPLGSVESCVGWPRVVVGDAANILSMTIDMASVSDIQPSRPHLWIPQKRMSGTANVVSVA
jgi:hypothetical protein